MHNRCLFLLPHESVVLIIPSYTKMVIGIWPADTSATVISAFIRMPNSLSLSCQLIQVVVVKQAVKWACFS